MHIILSKKEYEELLAYKAKSLNDQHKHSKSVEKKYLYDSISSFEAESKVFVHENFKQGWDMARAVRG